MEDVLLIDDDVELGSMLTDYLGRNGFRVSVEHRGDTGLRAATEKQWAVILLDIMLPGLGGLELLKQLRTTSRTSVLLLTARGEDVDRIVGLEVGADDYLPKPFNPRELLARMRAILRRTTGAEAGAIRRAVRVDDLELDPAARNVSKSGQDVNLTDVEFALLEALMQSPGTVLSRDALSEKVLGRRFSPFDRSLDMHISRLRRKLSEVSGGDDMVRTIRSEGYQLLVRRARTVIKD